MPKSPAERVRAYRARRKEAGEPDATRKNRAGERKAYNARKRLASRFGAGKPFVGCDGEGCGVDELGRQNYNLFRMGDRELYTGERLTTDELLAFICDEPPGSILVGFAFGYDVTMILRDLPEKQQRKLFEPRVFGEGHSPFVWYKGFNIDYLPKNYLKVSRVNVIRTDEGEERRVVIKGSQRTIYETFGFFQKSFLKVLQEFEIAGKSDLERIASNKDARSEFKEITDEIRAYCALECSYLAQLMERLREYCNEAGIVPRAWSGAGKLASAMHAAHDTPKGSSLLDVIPPEVAAMANMAYYGGRFEITRVGAIKGTVHEYDIRSAYPAAMPRLPCLLHGRWEKFAPGHVPKFASLYVAHVCFTSNGADTRDAFGKLGGFPIRSKEGHLYWPLSGRGAYWSVEINAARRLGHDVRLRGGWQFIPGCECKPFDWVEETYDYRQSIGSQGPGYPLKLGLNSLYGKLAQRKGNGAYANMIWAGLITALTRAKINDVIAKGSDQIVMIATDAVYSLAPIPDLELGTWLGSWDHQTTNGLFIVQPGLYWCPEKRKRKSRGLSGKFFEEPGRTESFERAWQDYEAACNSNLEPDFPKVEVPVPGFIGLKLALARNKPELAGRWVNDTRELSFDYRNKRLYHQWDSGSIVTSPKPGGPSTVSIPHRDFLASGGAEIWEEARLMLDEQPDYVDLGVPWKD